MNAGQKLRRVYLVNSQTLGAACGYGEGRTVREAAEAALRIARERDSEATYIGTDRGGQVWFRGGVNC